MTDRNQRFPTPPIIGEGSTNIEPLKPFIAEFNKVVRWLKAVRDMSPDFQRNARTGGVAKLTSAMTAAVDSGGNRTAGSATATVHLRNRSTGVLESYQTGVTIYNSTLQEAAEGDWIQFKVDRLGDRYWDVADCPPEGELSSGTSGA